MSELKAVFEGLVGTSRRRRGVNVGVGLLTWLGVASSATGCGHYGVDLDGIVDASGEADESTKPDKPKPGETSPEESTLAASTSETTGNSAAPKTDYVSDAGKSIGETIRPVDTRSTEDAAHVDGTSGDAGGPRDASVDGSAGGDADVSGETTDGDAGRGRDTSGAQTSESLDAGPSTCGPSCSCIEGVGCSLLCVDEAECLANCESNAVCDLVVMGIAPIVKIECASGALCSALDMAAVMVDVTCSGEGDCHAECGGLQSCDVECRGPGRCATKCRDEAECNITCKAGAECYVVYDDLDHVTLNCDVGAINYCDGVVTCGLPCP